MKQPSYRDHDYVFGQAMLTLRSSMGLTQADLGVHLGVSRRSVVEWEAGTYYPKVEYLKELITLAVKHQVFSVGKEAEEIKTFWEAAHQKVPLNETWLAKLLSSTQPASLLRPANNDTPNLKQVPIPPEKSKGPRVAWDNAMAVPSFYGRAKEWALLSNWIIEDRCRIVSVLGMGGIGKSTLVVKLMHLIAENFEVVIWRSLRDTPKCDSLVEECLQILAPQPQTESAADPASRLKTLLDYMRNRRILLVLDNLETLLVDGEGRGAIRPGYDDYQQFLKLVAETQHQSCLVLTSREKVPELISFEGSHLPVRALRLSQLDNGACEMLLNEKDVLGTPAERVRLINAYAGNPLALKIVGRTIVDLFDGEVGQFLAQGEIIFGGVRNLLDQQFNRLGGLEQTILLWLAILREPASLDELAGLLVRPVSRSRILETLEGLYRRSLIERGQRAGSFTLQSVVLEYATSRLIETVSEAILAEQLNTLIEHGLALAGAREYVRQTQERLLVIPILALLRSTYHQQTRVEEHLVKLLGNLKLQSADTQGYGPANLLVLLQKLRGHLRGLDLSHLSIRNLHLQGVEMQDSSLREAVLKDSAFTETLDGILTAVISGSGDYWAVTTIQGEAQVWKANGYNLQPIWKNQTDIVYRVSASSDNRFLVGGCIDGIIKVWDISNGRQIWSGDQRYSGGINSVAFSPDDNLVASADDACVRLWDAHTGHHLQKLDHPGAVPVAVWSPAGRLLASSDVKGGIWLWEVQSNGTATHIQTLSGHSRVVTGLAFAPDGKTLASVSWDGSAKLWDLTSGQVQQTLAGNSDQLSRVAWSPDGRTLAISDLKNTIWLWDVTQESYRVTLQGHTALIKALTFLPDSRNLISGSQDGTLRVWDVASGQSVRIVKSFAVSLFDLSWSSDGTQLVSGDSETLVTIWDVTGTSAPRLLKGHTEYVFGVSWEPGGRRIASNQRNNEIRLWDPTSGECLEVIRHPEDATTFFYYIAWSPDGKWLACGTNHHGLLVWDSTGQSQRWFGDPFPYTIFSPIEWSPGSELVAGGSDDGKVFVWEVEGGTLIKQFEGHASMVTGIAWSPQGTYLVSCADATNGGELLLWDSRSGELLNKILGHPGKVAAVVWGAVSEIVVTGSSDGRLRWWNIDSGECLRVVEAHQGVIQSLRCSPDGTKVASCGYDGAIMLWDLKSGTHLQTVRRDRPYERLNITGIGGVTEAQKATLRSLGAIDDSA